MALKNEREILVVKKKIQPEAHGGSAWKVAYADFVTAMMAFFLLLWLLNATTEDQKQGISNYFEPVGAISGSTGSGGLVGGISATDPGPIEEPGQTSSREVTVRSQVVTVKEKDEEQGDPASQTKTPNRENLPNNSDEARQLDAAKAAIRRSMEEIPELLELFNSLSAEVTEEGLRIRLMDRDEHPLFEKGGTDLNESGKKLVKTVSEVVMRMPNNIQITGHTTSDDGALPSTGSNWDISMGRAYSGQRALVALGLKDRRILSVHGRANRVPLDPKKPDAAENRRIEITLLRMKPEIAPEDLVPPSLIE